jgi:FAD/FMN-containing dehydrogenase
MAAMASSQALAALSDIVGASYVLTAETPNSPYRCDWTGDYVASPLAIVRPASPSEVAAVVTVARTHGLKIVPQGGNTGLVGGTHAVGDDVILVNLDRLNRVRRLSPEDFSVTVEAGLTVQAIQDIASGCDRLFALSFGAQGSAQIGGALATNAGGLNVLRYSMARDLVLGLEVVLPDGRIVDMLSDLRKDNRGLDLKQLFIGTEGTLGIITAATLKLHPAIRHRQTALLGFADIEALVAFQSRARAHCADLLSAFEFIERDCIDLAIEHQPSLQDPIDDRFAVYGLIELSASGDVDLSALLESLLEAGMERGEVLGGTIAASTAQAANLWGIREAMVEAQARRGRHLRTDLSVPLSLVPALVRQLDSLLAERLPGWQRLAYGHVGDGNVHYNALPPAGSDDTDIRATIAETLPALYAVALALGGSFSAEHGIGRSRAGALQGQANTGALDVSTAIKHLLDPDGLFNPGCLFRQAG